MAFDIDEFKANGLGGSDVLRKTLFDVNIEGYDKAKYLINELSLKYTQWDGWEFKCKMIENENFDSLEMLKAMLAKADQSDDDEYPNIIITFYSTNGTALRTMNFKVYGLSYSGDFAWEKTDEIHFWEVEFYVKEDE